LHYFKFEEMATAGNDGTFRMMTYLNR